MTCLPIFIPKELLDDLNVKDRKQLSQILEGSRTFKIREGYYRNISCHIEEYSSVKEFSFNDFDTLTSTAESLRGIAALKTQADKVDSLQKELNEKQTLLDSINQIKRYLKEE